MKILAYLFVAFFLFSSSLLLFADPHIVRKDQILLTNEGIFCDIDGSLKEVQGIDYFCGYYIVVERPKVSLSCSECGSRRGPDGKCENPHCNKSGRNGPREKD